MQTIAPLKWIITGPPGSGKTSLIQALKERGQLVFEEVGRSIIQEELRTNGSAVPWDDLKAFSKRVLLFRELDHSTHSGEHQFYDRGIPDLAAYFLLNDQAIPADIHYSAMKNRYQTVVFGLPFWEEIYRQDSERKETKEEAKAIYAALRTVYSRYGYTWMELPEATVDHRVEVILKQVFG